MSVSPAVIAYSRGFNRLTATPEHFHPPATLQRSPSGSTLTAEPDEPPAYPVPWIESEDLPHPIEPIVVTVKEGETLFLPSGWWHRVEQEEGPDGLAVAIN